MIKIQRFIRYILIICLSVFSFLSFSFDEFDTSGTFTYIGQIVDANDRLYHQYAYVDDIGFFKTSYVVPTDNSDAGMLLACQDLCSMHDVSSSQCRRFDRQKHFEQFIVERDDSVCLMRDYATHHDPAYQKQMIAKLFLSHHISAEQAYKAHQQIEYIQAITKEIKKNRLSFWAQLGKFFWGEKRANLQHDQGNIKNVYNHEQGFEQDLVQLSDVSEYSFEVHDDHEEFNQKLFEQSINAPSCSPVKVTLEDVHCLHDRYAKVMASWSDIEHAYDQQCVTRLQNRLQALQVTQEQIQLGNFEYYQYEVNPEVRGYCMAHNLHYDIFDAGALTAYQDCLTNEILTILQSCTKFRPQLGYESCLEQLVYQNCKLALTAQLLNRRAMLDDASTITDLSHFFELYGRAMLDDQGEILGMQGVGHALAKWSTFVVGLVQNPKVTMHTVIEQWKQVGKDFYTLAKVIDAHAGPRVLLSDYLQDLKEIARLLSAGDVVGYLSMKSRVDARNERNAQMLGHMISQGALMAYDSVCQDPVAVFNNVTEVAVDNFIAGQAVQGVFKLFQVVGQHALHVVDLMNRTVPTSLQQTPLMYAQTSVGPMLLTQGACQEIGALAQNSVHAERITWFAKLMQQTKQIYQKVKKAVKFDRAKVAVFEKELKEVVSAMSIRNPVNLTSIQGIEQVDRFRAITKNFTHVSVLKSEEVLYLNLCEWLAPKQEAINKALKARGGLKIRNPVTKSVEAIIEELDLFHSLLGEMSPGALANRVKGGHLFIPELRAATLETGIIKPLQHGFFDMEIQYIGRNPTKYVPKTYFPVGTSVEKSVEILEDALFNIKRLSKKMNVKDARFIGWEIETHKGNCFAFLLEGTKAQAYPIVDIF